MCLLRLANALNYQSFVDEVVAWKCLRHPNIVPFLGISKILPVCLVSEWMAHGSVVSFLRDNPSEDRLKLVCNQPCLYFQLRVLIYTRQAMS